MVVQQTMMGACPPEAMGGMGPMHMEMMPPPAMAGMDAPMMEMMPPPAMGGMGPMHMEMMPPPAMGMDAMHDGSDATGSDGRYGMNASPWVVWMRQ